MHRRIATPTPSLESAIRPPASWIVVDTDTDAIHYFFESTQTFRGHVILFHDSDQFLKDLKRCRITPKMEPGFQIDDGPNAVIFGNRPVRLIVDLSQIQNAVSALNGLYDDPPRYLGRPLGPNVEIVTIIPKSLAISGLTDDCYSRMTNVIPLPPKAHPDCLKRIATIESTDIPPHAEIIEFHNSPKWQDIVFGSPKPNQEGIVQFESSPWISKLTQHPMTLVFKNPPINDRGFQAFLIQLAHGLLSIDVNGKNITLPPITPIICHGYTPTETAHIEHNIPKTVSGGPVFVVNTTTIDTCFSSVSVTDSKKMTTFYGILPSLFATGGTLVIQEKISAPDLQKIKWAIADHNALSPQKVALQTHRGPITGTPPTLWVTNRPALMAIELSRYHPNAVHIMISASTQPEDLLGTLDILSFKNREFQFVVGRIQLALDSGKTLILSGMESNSGVTKMLSSLFEPQPYLWVNGQRHTYHPEQIVGISTDNIPIMTRQSETHWFPPIFQETRPNPIVNPTTKRDTLEKAVREHPIVAIEGPPGCSKTYWAEVVGKALGGDDFWSISVGPDADPTLLIERREKNGDTLSRRLGPLMQWATTPCKGPDHFPTLVINEVTLLPKGFLNFLDGMLTPSRELQIGSNPILPKLSPNHRVITTTNPTATLGRTDDPMLEELSYPLYFGEDPEPHIKDQIVTPLLYRRGIVDPQNQAAAWKKITAQLPSSPTIRDYLDIAEQVAYDMTHPVDVTADDRWIATRQTQYPTFDFSNTSTRSLALTIRNRLRLAQLEGYMGKRGMLIEGPPGRGKDAVIDRLVPQLSRLTCTIGADYFEMSDRVNAVKCKGETLVISELNLLPSSIAESLLNDALTGHHHKQFFLFLTANSGREPFSDPFKNRLHVHYVDGYTQADTLSLVQTRLKAKTDAPNISTLLVDFHYRVTNATAKAGIPQSPTLRELLSTVNLCLQNSATPLESIVTQTYGLHLLRLGQPDVHTLLYPYIPLIKQAEPSQPISKPKPDTDSPVTITRNPSESVLVSHDAITDAPTESFTDPSLTESPIANEKLLQNPVPVPVPSLPAKATRAIDTRGEMTQTEEEVAKATSHFTFHPDVPSHDAHKREYRIYTYDHITDNVEIGLFIPKILRSHETFPKHVDGDLTPDTRHEIIGNFKIPAGNKLIALPSNSAEESFVEYSTHTQKALRFFRDPQSGFTYVLPDPETPTEIMYKLVLPRLPTYRYVNDFSNIMLPQGARFPRIPDSLRVLLDAIRIEDIVGLSKEAPYNTKIQKLSHYCSRFTQGFIPTEYDPRIKAVLAQSPDTDTGSCDMVNLILRRTGVCRHRCWAFLALAGYFGVDSRIVGNDIHYLMEIHGGTNHHIYWFKTELSEFGFRKIQDHSGQISKEMILAIQDKFIRERLNSNIIPIHNDRISISPTETISELEALVLSPHLSEKVRKQALLAFCKHMLDHFKLNPTYLDFEMPSNFDKVLAEIVLMAAPKWALFGDKYYRRHFLDSAKTLTHLSHQLHDHPELKEPITRFFTELLTYATTSNENDAITVMELIFTMQTPHDTHLNRFTLQRQTFDAFLHSPHSDLFKDRVATKFYKIVSFNTEAKVTTQEVAAIKGHYYSNAVIQANFTACEESTAQWIATQDLLIDHSPLENKDLFKRVRDVNATLFTLTQAKLTPEFIEDFLHITYCPFRKIDDANAEAIRSTFLKPLAFYIFHHMAHQGKDPENPDLANWVRLFGPIIRDKFAKSLISIAILIVENEKIFHLDTHPETRALIRDVLSIFSAEYGNHNDYTMSLRRIAKDIQLKIPNTQDFLYGDHDDSLQGDPDDYSLSIRRIATDIELKIPNVAWPSLERLPETDDLKALIPIISTILQPKGYANDIRKELALTTLFDRQHIPSETQFRWFETHVVPACRYAFQTRPVIGHKLIHSYISALDRLQLESQLPEDFKSYFHPLIVSAPLGEDVLKAIITSGPIGLHYAFHMFDTSPIPEWPRGYAISFFYTLPKEIDDPEMADYLRIMAQVIDSGFTNAAIGQQLSHYMHRTRTPLPTPFCELLPKAHRFFESAMAQKLTSTYPQGFCQGNTDMYQEYLRGGLKDTYWDNVAQLGNPSIPTASYSYTTGHDIDYTRTMSGAPFLRTVGFTSSTANKPSIIRGSLRHLCMNPQDYQDIDQVIASDIWKRTGGNVAFATFWGSAQPTSFEEFSKIILFLEAKARNQQDVIIPQDVYESLYPDAIYW